MRYKKILQAALASALIIGATAPVYAQGLLDRMKEDAQRRAENKAVRDAENPQATKKTDTSAAPAQPAAAAQSASATPATPATPTPAPAQ
jgi:hypothetical protein